MTLFLYFTNTNNLVSLIQISRFLR